MAKLAPPSPICATKTHFYADALDGLVGIVLGTIDDNHKYPPNSEIFTNYKLNWLKDNGCITESFEEAAVYERLEKVLNPWKIEISCELN